MIIKQSSAGWWIVEGDSHISKWVEQTGHLAHDKLLITLACSHIREGDFVIDCGANIGSHTSAYAHAVGETGLVVAVEPGDLACQCLVRNMHKEGLKNVKPIRAAVSDFCGKSVTHVQDKNLGASTCKFSENEGLIPTITLDSIVEKERRRVNFIKLDVEGWEVDALRGGLETISEHNPILLIEVNRGALKLHGDTPEDLFKLLGSIGYEWKICQPQCNMGDLQFDILAIHK